MQRGLQQSLAATVGGGQRSLSGASPVCQAMLLARHRAVCTCRQSYELQDSGLLADCVQVIVMAAGTNDFQVGLGWPERVQVHAYIHVNSMRWQQPRCKQWEHAAARLRPPFRHSSCAEPASWTDLQNRPPPQPHPTPPIGAGLQTPGGPSRQTGPLCAAHTSAVGRRVCGIHPRGGWRGTHHFAFFPATPGVQYVLACFARWRWPRCARRVRVPMQSTVPVPCPSSARTPA